MLPDAKVGKGAIAIPYFSRQYRNQNGEAPAASNTMKLKLLCATALLTALVATAASFAPGFINQGRVRQLLETKQCAGCELGHANLEGANLEGANLEGANLKGANLARANLENANLERANLEQANLENTSLGSANLGYANLKDATLAGANLGCVGLNFKMSASADGAAVNFNIGSSPTKQQNFNSANLGVNFNMDADEQGATLSFNLLGCAEFEGANLSGATLPDGSIHN